MMSSARICKAWWEQWVRSADPDYCSDLNRALFSLTALLNPANPVFCCVRCLTIMLSPVSCCGFPNAGIRLHNFSPMLARFFNARQNFQPQVQVGTSGTTTRACSVTQCCHNTPDKKSSMSRIFFFILTTATTCSLTFASKAVSGEFLTPLSDDAQRCEQ